MAHKKYYGYKPEYEYYNVTLYEKDGEVGEEICFTYDNGQCFIQHNYWGSEMEYEWNSDGFLEHTDHFDKENTKLLILRTGTKNGKELVNAIYERFHRKKSNAVNKIREWCDKKGIKHEFDVCF